MKPGLFYFILSLVSQHLFQRLGHHKFVVNILLSVLMSLLLKNNGVFAFSTSLEKLLTFAFLCILIMGIYPPYLKYGCREEGLDSYAGLTRILEVMKKNRHII